jgi:hypothetical protein
LAVVLGAEDWTSQIAGKWWAKTGNGAIVLGKACQAIRRAATVGCIEFLGGFAAMLCLERIDQRAANAEAGHDPETG